MRLDDGRIDGGEPRKDRLEADPALYRVFFAVPTRSRTGGNEPTERLLAPYLWDYRWRVLAALAFMVGAKLANVGVPLLLKQLVDALTLTPQQAVLVVPAMLLLTFMTTALGVPPAVAGAAIFQEQLRAQLVQDRVLARHLWVRQHDVVVQGASQADDRRVQDDHPAGPGGRGSRPWAPSWWWPAARSCRGAHAAGRWPGRWPICAIR